MLSGGERTRLAVARMLLRPSNTLLLDEPTNHLDLDSKDVLLEALEDFGGTLIFVSHDRYFVDRLATKVDRDRRRRGAGLSGHLRGVPVEPQAAGGRARRSGARGRHRRAAGPRSSRPAAGEGAPARRQRQGPQRRAPPRPQPQASYEERKRQEAEARRERKAADARRQRIDELESRIAEREQAIKDIEATMSAPGFYDNHEKAKPVIDRHQALMWEVGDLMNQWEALQQDRNRKRRSEFVIGRRRARPPTAPIS